MDQSRLKDVSDFINMDGWKPETVSRYLHELRQFMRWDSSSSWADITPDTLQDYLTFCKGNGAGVPALARKVVVLRMFFSWLKFQRRIPANPAVLLRDPRYSVYAPRNVHIAHAARYWSRPIRGLAQVES